LEKQNTILSESISVVKTVKEKWQNLQGEKRKAIYTKLVNVLLKSEEFEMIVNISNILEGIDDLIENLKDLEVNNF
jgi:HKD family nuclease